MRTKEQLLASIAALKKEKNGVILAHYYCNDEVQAIADYVGDSFYLAKVAKEIDADTIVFCGVSFMGESAKILCPRKTVLMPDLSADCAMAHMADVKKIEEMRRTYPDLAVVCYINSTAELKCHSDVCVTSSNAVRIVKALPNQNIFFIPDENLGRFVKEQVPEKNVMLCDGYCPIHKALTAEQILIKKREYPDALVLSHPECRGEVLALSDYIGSTADIIQYAKSSTAKRFIICTEVGVAYRLRQDNPDKIFVFCDPCPCCTDMKLNTVEKILEVLESGKNAIEVSEERRRGALAPLNKMLELAK
ncbi:MAG: quinolinate synthase NadA [Ruminococcaceae bacterium]|nr:quinolinate synthase NadA [Oscillospiraceae bacterium]